MPGLAAGAANIEVRSRRLPASLQAAAYLRLTSVAPQPAVTPIEQNLRTRVPMVSDGEVAATVDDVRAFVEWLFRLLYDLAKRGEAAVRARWAAAFEEVVDDYLLIEKRRPHQGCLSALAGRRGLDLEALNSSIPAS